MYTDKRRHKDVCIVVKMCCMTIDEDDCAEEEEDEALLPHDHEHAAFSISSASTERSVSAK